MAQIATATPTASYVLHNITKTLYSTTPSTGKIRLGYFEEKDEFISSSDNPLSHIDNPTLRKIEALKDKYPAMASILDILATQLIVSDVLPAQTNEINLLA